MYASLGTRLDITYFVNYISRYLTKPTKYIEKIVRQTIAYLLNTPFIYIICFASYNKSPQITAFCDASHGSELNRKGTSGGLVKLGHTCIIWYSTKQTTFSLSTAETEYKALSNIGKEVTYSVCIVDELMLKQELPSKIYEDNTAAISMTDNPIINKKSKHIEMAYHQFIDLVQKKKVQVLYVSTKYQQADILTKVLGTIDLHYSMIKQAYNLQAIVSTNTTLMVKGVNMSFTSVISLEQQIYINYMYVKQSYNPMDERDILDDVKQNLWKTSNKVTTEFTHNDRSFEIKHLVMHASVISYLITLDASKFPKFFPIVMQLPFVQ
jgi:hypothetical protein